MNPVTKPDALFLCASDWVPNNPTLPALFYRHVVATGDSDKTATALETLFQQNAWPAQ